MGGGYLPEGWEIFAGLWALVALMVLVGRRIAFPLAPRDRWRESLPPSGARGKHRSHRRRPKPHRHFHDWRG